MSKRENYLRKSLLPKRKLIKVRNAKAAESRLGDFIDSKLHRGYRLRVVKNVADNTVELSHHNNLNIDMAIRELQECKLYLKTISWKINDILKQ